MKNIRFIIAFHIVITLLLFFGFNDAKAQMPDVSSPSKEACFDQGGKLINCGESFIAVVNGITYDCTCNCSGENTCTPRTQSQSGTSSNTSSNERPRLRAERQRMIEEAAKAEADKENQKAAEEKAEQERQATFEREKKNLLGAMKGSDTDASQPVYLNSGSGTVLPLKSGTSSVSPGLKGGVSGQTNTAAGQPTIAEIDSISTEVASLKAKVPPPLEDVTLTVKEDPLLETAETLMSLWEAGGTIGSKVIPPAKVLFIAYKTIIAGADQANIYLIRQDDVFNKANKYLKNPATAGQFAELMRSIRTNSNIPASTDPEMLIAARAVSDPKVNSVSGVFWDAMISREAMTAMVCKAMVESGKELLGAGAGGILGDLTQRKEIYESTRIARNKALNALKYTKDPEKIEALEAIVKRSNEIIEGIYRIKGAATDYVSGKVADKVSDRLTPKDEEANE